MKRSHDASSPSESNKDARIDRISIVLKHEYGWGDDFITNAVAEFERFMSLKRRVDDRDATILSPSSVVDRVWHAHILDTRNYKYGEYHHDPVDHILHPEARDERYRKTLKLYAEVFGHSPPSAYWNAAPRVRPSNADSVVQVFTKNLSGNTKTYEVTLDDSVYSFVEKIAKGENVPIYQIRLIYSGMQLNVRDDDETNKRRRLWEFGVDKESTVHLMHRMCGC